MEKHKFRSFKFGTWNVFGLTERKREVLSEIRRENEDVVVLTETKLRGVGEEELEGYFHFYSGITTGVARAGVSILLKKQLTTNIKWKSVSERIIVVEFKMCGRTIVVMGVYWLDDCAKPAMKEAFQHSLRSVVENVDKKYELVILGDFNSRVGVDQNSCVVGKYGDPVVSNNGRRLIEMCKDLNLKIQNTFFNHEDKHKYTWYHSQQSRRTLIDFCITRQDPSFIVDDVVACRWLECGTDHVFLEATLSFQLQAEGDSFIEPEDNSALNKYRTYLLYSKAIRNSYKDYLDVEIDQSVSRTTKEIYQCLKDAIHSAASFVLGTEKNDNSGEFLWDQEIRDLRELRQRNRNLMDTTKLFLEMDITESQFQNIKNEIWEGMCSEIDNTHKCRKNKTAWDIVNDMQNNSPKNFVMHCEHLVYEPSFKTSTEIAFSVKQSFSNKTHPEGLLNINNHDIDTALNNLDDSNIPVPGGLTIKLLKHSSNKTKILLTKLIQNMFNGEEIPKEISEIYCTNNMRNNKETFMLHNEYSWHSIMRVMRVILNNILIKCLTFKEFYQEISIDSYSDATFILRQILQKTFDKQNPPFHFAFLDLKILFSDIECSKLFECLSKENISNKLISIIKHLFEGSNIRMIDSGRVSEEFCSSKGLTDDSLSCTLLKMYLKNALKSWSEENAKHGVPIGNKRLLVLLLRYSNLVILSESNVKMKSVITSLKLHLQTMGLGLNFQYMKYLSREDIKIDGKIIKGTEIVHLHNSILEYDGRNVEEIFQRVLDAKEVIGILHPVARDKMITKKNKRRIFKSIILNLLVYGCETWTMTEDLKKPLEHTELRYWKWCCDNYPQRYTRQEIRDMMDVKETVSRIIMLKKAAWYTHIMDADKTYWVRHIMDWEPDGVMKCGRPRKKWVDGLEDFLKSFGNYQIYFQKKKEVREHNRLTNSSDFNVDSDKVNEKEELALQL